MMVRDGAEPGRSLFAVSVVFFGSLWFGYSTIAMPYSAGIACCLGAIYVLLYQGRAITSGRASAVGFLCGFALICDFIFGLIVLPIALVFLMTMLREPAASRLRHLLAAAVGGAAPLIAFFTYTFWIFGTPSIPYQFEASPLFRAEMARGLMGITTPRLAPAWFLTFHPYRGVIFWSPWILVALAGCLMGLKATGRRRTWGWMGLWAFAASLVFNSGYHMWWGGWAMGARLMLPMMAALPMGLTEACRTGRRRAWWATLVVSGIASVASLCRCR